MAESPSSGPEYDEAAAISAVAARFIDSQGRVVSVEKVVFTPENVAFLFFYHKTNHSLRSNSNCVLAQSPHSQKTDNSCKFISHLLLLVPLAGGLPSSTLGTGRSHHHLGSLKRWQGRVWYKWAMFVLLGCFATKMALCNVGLLVGV